ncbi:MAG: winged helix-turn-helix transcriptional regulator [Cyanobacteria bacterium J06636_16]
MHSKAKAQSLQFLLRTPETPALVLVAMLIEHSGLVNRTVYAEVPPRVEYRLTDLGNSLVQPIIVLFDWAEQNHEVIKSCQNQK